MEDQYVEHTKVKIFWSKELHKNHSFMNRDRQSLNKMQAG